MLFTSQVVVEIGVFGMVPDASCLAIMVYLELLELVM